MSSPHLGVTVAVAIAIHNIPGTSFPQVIHGWNETDNVRVGRQGCGSSMHAYVPCTAACANADLTMPCYAAHAEGIALGVPVFFATGSRWKAIGWAAASGLAEPLGALIGLALQLTGRLNPVAMGIIMACVAGVMTGIAFQVGRHRICANRSGVQLSSAHRM